MNLMIMIWVVSFIILLIIIYRKGIYRRLEGLMDWLGTKSLLYYVKVILVASLVVIPLLLIFRVHESALIGLGGSYIACTVAAFSIVALCKSNV